MGEFTIRWMNSDVRALPTSLPVDRLLQDIAAGEIPADEVPQLMNAMRAQIAHRMS